MKHPKRILRAGCFVASVIELWTLLNFKLLNVKLLNMKLSSLDSRLKLLFALAVLGVMAVGVTFAWWFWATNVRLQFGDSAQWPEHIKSANNMAFRYPSAMEVIVPEDELSNPVSLVKKGERGESVLIQVGTWRPGMQLENLDAAAARYEQAVSRRKTIAREYFSADDHEGILLIQNEASGRRVIEAFVLDNPSGSGEPGFREISLQLPGTASAVDRALYEKVLRDIFASLDFLTGLGEAPDGRPSGIPESWHKYENEEGGFMMWYPREWTVASEFEEEGIQSAIFQPTEETKNAIPVDGGKELAFAVHAGPKDDFKTIAELDENFASLFRSSAIAGTLHEERFSFPGIGTGLSLEAMHATGLSQLVLLVASETDSQDIHARGRAYVLSALFPNRQENDPAVELARFMTKSLRLRSE